MAHVLIVDDAFEAQEPLGKYLEKHGYEVTLVPNGREALGELIYTVPDVVIVDLLMPEMDGPSLIEVTRAYLRLQSLPVIVLTAMEDGPLIARAQNAKVNAILKKTKATFEDIRRAVEDAVVRIPG